MTPTSDHLRRALAADPGRPRLTFYDDATGERVELSGTTLANWVAKTVNLLTLGCGVGPGACVSLHLPRHWQLAVWVLAADAAGADVVVRPGATTPGPAERPADVAVVGPDGVDDPPDADEVFACSLLPLAAPFRRTLPPLVQDYAVAARAMPDAASFSSSAGPGELGRRAEEQVARWALTGADRVAALGPDPDLAALVREWLAPLAAGASAVWVRNPDADRNVPRWDSERVTSVVRPLPDGLSVPEAIRILT